MRPRDTPRAIPERPIGGVRSAFIAVSLALAVTPRLGAAAPVAPAATVFGQTGTATVNSADVLPSGRSRVGLITHRASGGAGNRVDLLLGDAVTSDTVTVLRGALTLGLPGNIEVAITAPYANVETDDVSMDGPGDATLSAKQRLWDQRGWRPAAAVSASWIAETSRHVELGSVTTNGYLATMAGELNLVSGEHTWSVLTELGGFWRDPGHPESDSSLVYGVAIVIPLAQAGLLEDTGEFQFIAEASGTSARRSLSREPDDALSFVPGFRYLANSWGVSANGVFTSYERTGKKDGAGGLLEVYVLF
jgi:hypothetical protein